MTLEQRNELTCMQIINAKFSEGGIDYYELKNEMHIRIGDEEFERIHNKLLANSFVDFFPGKFEEAIHKKAFLSDAGKNYYDYLKSIVESDRKELIFKNQLSEVNTHTIRASESTVEASEVQKANFTLQIITSIVTVVIAGLAAWISWLSYLNSKTNDETIERLKSLEIKASKTEQQIQQMSKSIQADSFHQKSMKDSAH
jgi:hypothetical protein